MQNLPEYKLAVTQFRTYEFLEGDDKTNSYRDAINSFVGLGTGREFAEKFTDDVWNLRKNAEISFCRFSDGSEVEYIGRDCMTKGLLSFDEASDMAYRAMLVPYYMRLTFHFEDGRIIEVWHTETGKRQNEGMAIVKTAANKTYKRNRRSNW